MKYIYIHILLILSFLYLSSCKFSESTKEIENNDTINNLIYSKKDSIAFAEKAHKFDSIFTYFYKKRNFNGNVLIAQKGRIIFEKSFGYSNIKKKEKLKLNSTFQLASVSKQFTAVAILQLIDKGVVTFEDTIQKFYPEFPFKNITIKMLLTHRSGLPNYIYFTDDIVKDKSAPLYNSQVIDSLIKYSPSWYYPPNKRFDYSNTGYMLLASIVEKVSGMSFARYMQENIFVPLRMKNSYIYEKGRTELRNNATGYLYGKKEAEDNFLNGVTGDKGVYTTVEDLLKWDQGLYTEKIISQKTLQEAFKPWNKQMRQNRNYGFGWRLQYFPDSSVVYFHRGWWQGFQNLLLRIPQDSSTVIVLRNKKTCHYIQFREFFDILYPNHEFFNFEQDSIIED